MLCFMNKKVQQGPGMPLNPSTSETKVGVSLLSSKPSWSASEFQDSKGHIVKWGWEEIYGIQYNTGLFSNQDLKKIKTLSLKTLLARFLGPH